MSMRGELELLRQTVTEAVDRIGKLESKVRSLEAAKRSSAKASKADDAEGDEA